MHKININLHNLKTARLFVSTWFTYVPKLHNFSPLRGRKSERGVGILPPPPPPPGCEMGSKDPASLGLTLWRKDFKDC